VIEKVSYHNYIDYREKPLIFKKRGLTQNRRGFDNHSMSCCSNAAGPIAIIAKTSLSNTIMTIIATITTIMVHRSPSTICSLQYIECLKKGLYLSYKKSQSKIALSLYYKIE
jgi:hypothetical protein